MQQKRAWRWALGLLAGIGVSFWSVDAIAASRIILKYRSFQIPVSVGELTTLSETGEAPPRLRAYLRVAGQNPQDFQQTLNREVPINVRLLDRALNNPVGNLALDEVSEAIYTQSGDASRQAIRAALVLSASGDNRISLIEVIQNYPTQEVYVDGDRLVAAYNQIQGLQEQMGGLLERLDQIRLPEGIFQ